jgi:ribosomal-protein-alanine N-acetyltransferase
MLIRTATAADIPSLLAIESQAATAAHWTVDTYTHLLERDSPRLVLVLEESGSIQAFIVVFCASPEWEIENVAVSDEARHRGLGSCLVSDLLERACASGTETVFLEVREANTAARRLYEKWAFSESGRRPRYYSNPPEDAILYRLDLPVLPPVSKETDVTIL